jgi:hypothetical protein
MSLVISKVFTYDTDAGDYIQRVEGASGDNQALEPATRQAINNFVIGCKQDGIWNAIKASCILSGARTLNGALQPLVGTAPTNVGPFVTGDYNRKTGLVGDGSTKYLNSNRNNNVDPQNNRHISVFASSAETMTAQFRNYCGALGNVGAGRTDIEVNGGNFASIGISGAGFPATGAVSRAGPPVNFIGAVRTTSINTTTRVGGVSQAASTTSDTPYSANMILFARNILGSITQHTNARLAFYSIGESLDLALLDARVTALITAFGVAIP